MEIQLISDYDIYLTCEDSILRSTVYFSVANTYKKIQYSGMEIEICTFFNILYQKKVDTTAGYC